MLGCGEVIVADVDAMTCPVEPAPVQCEQCATLCPETGWGIAYAELFDVAGAGSWEYGGFAALVNTGTDALQVSMPTIASIRGWSTGLDLLVQADTEPQMARIEPGAAHGALGTEAKQVLIEAGVASGALVEGSRPWLTWNMTAVGDRYFNSATKLVELEVAGLPGRAVLPLTVYAAQPVGPIEPYVKASSARFVCAHADD
jgi:hypothetical protein